MAREEEDAWRFPALRPPPVLFPPPASAAGSLRNPTEPPLDRYRGPAHGAGPAGVERYLVFLEALLPDPQGALSRLMAKQGEDGAKLWANWKLDAKEVQGGAFDVTFTPLKGRQDDRALLASGTFGPRRVEVDVALARGSPADEEGLRERLRHGRAFAWKVPAPGGQG